ncbi:MAG TPA: AAA family ATPase [Candidatus Acidoferrales bacterium]|jgi:DNA repair exonuclease SbcCD ATPase subunit|nr:AAA family ATPase [Candidatus Acidoferrales bacterium]
MWMVQKIEISGGFLPGLSVNIPQGLTCIIGARGSGKSTLAEAVRFALCGISAAPKQCADLIQANLAGGALVTITALAEGSNTYTIKRGLKQNPVLLTSDGRAINTVDLDRGTFLPLDAYSSLEIESIADEVLGDKRRNLLDELRSEQMRTIHLSLAESTRALETNADRIRTAQRTIDDLTEQIEELGDVRARLSALAPSDRESSADFVRLSRQQQLNQREIAKLDSADRDLRTLGQTLEQLRSAARNVFAARLAEEQSANADTVRRYDDLLAASLGPVDKHLSAINARIGDAQGTLAQARQAVIEIHTSHAGELARLNAVNQAASEQARVRASLEQQAAKLEALEQQRAELNAESKLLFERRKSLKADHILMRDQISTMRDEVASELQHESGERVRIRVMRNADHLAYQQMLVDGLKGARVRNQNEILATLMQLRPEQLAQLIQSNDLDSFEELTHFGTERSRKILDSFRENVDPLALEITAIEDRIGIELNVATAGGPHFKDASDLSRGQKCTALLPILLARRDNPLIIDQPEDNLDNHFIFETVVNAVKRMKKRRQMIFITHNANIPVLAEAELVLVMNSDGRVGAIEKFGTVDECREQIIDLLEGGREAFDLRSKRYAAG